MNCKRIKVRNRDGNQAALFAMSKQPVSYVDFDRCIVCVNPNAPLVPDDRSEKQSGGMTW